VTEGDDPLSQALRGLIDHASGHEHQITMLWKAIETLAQCAQSEAARGCLPKDAQTTEDFDAEGLNKLVK
jgi:serine O-acetyltransferase